MKLTYTANEIMVCGDWLKFCEIKGINEYAMNEGLMSGNEEFELTEDEAREIGLIAGDD